MHFKPKSIQRLVQPKDKRTEGFCIRSAGVYRTNNSFTSTWRAQHRESTLQVQTERFTYISRRRDTLRTAMSILLMVWERSQRSITVKLGKELSCMIFKWFQSCIYKFLLPGILSALKNAAFTKNQEKMSPLRQLLGTPWPGWLKRWEKMLRILKCSAEEGCWRDLFHTWIKRRLLFIKGSSVELEARATLWRVIIWLENESLMFFGPKPT